MKVSFEVRESDPREAPRSGLVQRALHERELTYWDTATAASRDTAILEIFGSVKERSLLPYVPGVEAVGPGLCDRIDRVKWAFAVGLGNGRMAPIESVVILNDALGGGLPPSPPKIIRREEKTAGTAFQVTNRNLSTLSALISAADRYAGESKDVAEAFRHWGRSAAASLRRDQLLEAVIGLERLLVSGSGESAYRLATTGTALLVNADDERQSLWREFKALYRLRSRAAHGAGLGESAPGRRAMAFLGQGARAHHSALEERAAARR